MISTRRGFLTTLAGLATVSPWRAGWKETSPPDAHDTPPSPATASAAGHHEDQPWPDTWLLRPRLPLARSHLPQLGKSRESEWFTAALLMERLRNGRPIHFLYQGGSTPGESRNVLPVLIFTVPTDLENPDHTQEPLYLLAHCLTRQAARTFRLDRIQLT